jgi:hypothetical protein
VAAVVVVVSVSALVLWLTGIWPRGPIDRAVARIEDRGGQVKRDGGFWRGDVLSVKLSGRKFTDDDLALLEGIPDLEELNLFEAQVTDDGLKKLRPLHNLRKLNLQRTQITDAGLAELQNHPSLEELDIQETKVTDAGLKNLTPLTNLRLLATPSATFTPRGFRVFRDLNLIRDFPGLQDAAGERATRLEDIHTLAFPPLTTSAVSLSDWLAEFPTLRIIQVDPDVVTDDFLRAVARMGKLHMLHIFHFRGDKDFFPLLHKSAIERADKERPDRDEDITQILLYSCPISDASLDILLSLKKLELVDLGSTRVTTAGFVRLAALPALSRISAYSMTLTAAELQPFKDRKNLWFETSFDLSDAGLKAYREAGVLHLICRVYEEDLPGGQTKVDRELDLEGSSVTDAGLDELKDFHDFYSLDLSRTKVSDAGLAKLADHAEIQFLHLRETSITDAGLEHLTMLPNLEGLDLEATGISDDGLQHLSKLAKLKSLNLKGTGIGNGGLTHLTKLSKLEELSLNGTKVRDAGPNELRALTALQKLDLRETDVTDAGLFGLKSLTKARKIELWDTYVTTAGLQELKDALPGCKVSGRAKQVKR